MRSPLLSRRHGTQLNGSRHPVLDDRSSVLADPASGKCLSGRRTQGPLRPTRLPTAGGLFGLGLTLLSACSSPRPPLLYQPVWTESGVIIQDQLVPTDEHLPEAATGDRLTIHYRAWLSDGTLVDSSYERGLPVDFTLGAGEVPAGLEVGLLGMRLMGRRALFVPAELAYGDDGLSGQVPPDERVRFVVELLALEPAPAERP
jgi:hypothetical protein